MAKDYAKMTSANKILKEVTTRRSSDESRTENVPLTQIRLSKENSMIWGYRKEDISLLMESYKKRGFIGSIGVYRLPKEKIEKDGAIYEIFSGHMRYLAQKESGAMTIPCQIFDYPASEAEKWDTIIGFNTDGRQETVVERAQCITAWVDNVLFAPESGNERGSVNVLDSVAERFGISRQTVKRLISIEKLPSNLKEFIAMGVPYSALSDAPSLEPADQEKLVGFLWDYLEKHEEPPTREIVSAFIKKLKQGEDNKKDKSKKQAKFFIKSNDFRKELKKISKLSDSDKVLAKNELLELSEQINKILNEL